MPVDLETMNVVVGWLIALRIIVLILYYEIKSDRKVVIATSRRFTTIFAFLDV